MEKEVVKLDPLSLEPSDTGVLYLKITRDSGAVAIEAISSRVETIVLSDKRVADVTYTFDVDSMEYVEKSRVERDIVSSVSEVDTLKQNNARLKEQVDATQSAVMALMDMLMS